MREHLKRERYQRKLAALLHLDLNVIPKTDPVNEEDKSRIADAVLLYLIDHGLFNRLSCELCHRDYLTNKTSGRFCSNACSRLYSERIGIPRKNFDHPSTFWSHFRYEPIKIEPNLLKILDQLDGINGINDVYPVHSTSELITVDISSEGNNTEE
jgi:hypothetical protein